MAPYVIRYKQGKEIVVANALSKRYALLISLQTKFLGFEMLKDLYVNDIDFSQVWYACDKSAFNDYYRHESFLFKKDKVRASISFVHE